MKIGDRVRVSESVLVYHRPKNGREPCDIKGYEGEILTIIDKPVSATLPVYVKFDKKFKVHLKETELEIIS